MEKPLAIAVLSALSQPVRLEAFLLLAGALPDGMASGDLAIATASSPNTMSAHLAILSRAGLVMSDKAGRYVIYRAVVEPVDELASFLTDACRTERAGGGSRHQAPRRAAPRPTGNAGNSAPRSSTSDR